MVSRPIQVLGFSVLAACGGDDDGEGPADARAADAAISVDAAASVDAGGASSPDASPLAGRPYTLVVPSGYVAGTPTPLVMLLHGYGVNGVIQEAYFQLQPVAEAETFLYAWADGTANGLGQRFWNATDACCDVGGAGVDDVAYLTAVLDDIAARYTVDPKRVYLVGHSNGGFMAHRMACDRADRIAAIVSLAGATWADPERCHPTQRVAVVEVHGTSDAVISYNGGMVPGETDPYPSAPVTTATWGSKNGCAGSQAAGTLDLVADLAGAETTIQRADGCAPGGATELWTIAAGGHIPSLQPTWAATLWAFFAAHPKP